MTPRVNYWTAFGPRWFARWQTLLLALLDEPVLGRWVRRILCITPGEPGHRGRIIAIRPDSYTVDNSDGTHTLVSRTHWKYSKRIYHAARPLWWAMHWFDETIANPFVPEWNLGFDSFGPAYPDADTETTTVDGEVTRESVDEAIGTISSGNGTGANDSGATMSVLLRASTTTDQYQKITRWIGLFDTSSMGAGATVSAGTLSFTSNLKDTSQGDPTIHAVASSPASNTSLGSGDFQTMGGTSFGSIAAGSITADSSTYNDITLNSSGLAAFDPSGVTKFGFRTHWDLNGDATGFTWASGADSRIGVICADTAGTTTDPKLVATYTPAQQGLPTANYSTTSWTEGAGDADGDWFDELDEGVDAADDATTYWASGNNPSSLPIAVTLGSLTDPSVGTGHIVRTRWRANPSGARVLNVTVELLDTDGTSRASFSHNGVEGTTAWTTWEDTLSEAQANAITDYSGLKIRVTANVTGGGSPSGLNVSAVDLITPAASSSTYSVTVDPASYTVTGAATTNLRHLIESLTPTSYTVTGADATLRYARTVSLDPASYTVTGADLSFTRHLVLSADPASYAVSGAAATLARHLIVSVDPTSYAVTGADVTFRLAKSLTADPGSFTVTGAATTNVRHLLVDADPGAFTLTGSDVTFRNVRVLSADPGSFTVTGADVTALRHLVVEASPGSYTVSGTALTTLRHLLVSLDPGTYTATGATADLLRVLTLTASPASFAVTGADVTFTFTEAPVITPLAVIAATSTVTQVVADAEASLTQTVAETGHLTQLAALSSKV